MSDQETESPIIKLVYAILLSGVKKQARFIRIGRGSVELRIDGAWNHEMAPPDALIPPIVRRLAVMMGVQPPGTHKQVSGSITLSVGDRPGIYCRARLGRQGGEVFTALLELVSQAELLERVEPRLPDDSAQA